MIPMCLAGRVTPPLFSCIALLSYSRFVCCTVRRQALPLQLLQQAGHHCSGLSWPAYSIFSTSFDLFILAFSEFHFFILLSFFLSFFFSSHFSRVAILDGAGFSAVGLRETFESVWASRKRAYSRRDIHNAHQLTCWLSPRFASLARPGTLATPAYLPGQGGLIKL